MLAPPPATAAENTRYRVEILVLTHLRQAEQPREELRIEDYSSALDFLTPPEEEQEDAPEEADASVPGAELDDEAATGAAGEAGLEAEPEEPDPNEVVHVEEMSDVMQEAWRRLRLSGPFRPEQYLSWEQGSEEPFPALRIHDLQIVWVDDPYADLRPDFEAQEGDKAPVFADAAGLDALGLESAPTLPDPKVHYRLDGSVALKRSRFLHLYLDLQLREPLWEAPPPAPGGVEWPETEPRNPSAYLVHELRQNRQVKTGRMEYFDGPVMGVLAFITSVEPEPDTALEAGGESD